MNICSFPAFADPRDGWGHMGNGAWAGWMMGWGLLLLLLTVAAVTVAVVLVIRATERPPRTAPPAVGRPDDGVERGRGILAERYARGEIDTAEYRERLATLAGPPGDPG
ncbi:hypothetical protein [Actinomadura rugatobispora]|uniref:SHOCT domain-containing protein n=1 Tax=Actinomadura rugatobispora TaxID=1994 RepID=A0ABW0ZY48_9ACTN|nr:hypothetical protein GCM10010200_080060 [Actinomadura rugatobispora]